MTNHSPSLSSRARISEIAEILAFGFLRLRRRRAGLPGVPAISGLSSNTPAMPYFSNFSKESLANVRDEGTVRTGESKFREKARGKNMEWENYMEGERAHEY